MSGAFATKILHPEELFTKNDTKNITLLNKVIRLSEGRTGA